MKFYAYKGNAELGKEPLGSQNRYLFELKTIRGAKKRCNLVFKGEEYKLYTYTNFYKDDTFREVK